MSQLQEAVKSYSTTSVIDEIRRQFENLKLDKSKASAQQLSKEKNAPAYDVAKMDHARAAKSETEYVDRLDNVELHYGCLQDFKNGIPDGLYCTDCTVPVAPVAYGTTPGVVRCPNIATGEYTKKEFQNLKTHMKDHMDSKRHKKNMDGKAEVMSKEVKKLRETAAINCTRIAYNAITKSHSYQAYEMDITVADANGTYVGTKNHSREYCRDMVQPLYESLLEKFQEQITTPLQGTGRPSPFTQVCDKWTG